MDNKTIQYIRDHFPPNSECPLCLQPAFVQPSREIDGDGVICIRCGSFRIEAGALTGYEQQRHLLSGITRHATPANPERSLATRITINCSNVQDLLSSISLPKDLLDQLDITLEYCRDHQPTGHEHVEYRNLTETDFPFVFAHSPREFLHFFHILCDQELLDEPIGRDVSRKTSFRITAKGWQRLRELASVGPRSDRAFVAMSFALELVPAWMEGFEPALKSLGYEPLRIDKTHADNKIDDRILAEIRRSGLMVADFTGHRGGVYFEAGFAMGLGIPIVWTCKQSDIDTTHFDTRQYQHLLWDTPKDLEEKLINHIAARIPGRSLPQ